MNNKKITVYFVNSFGKNLDSSYKTKFPKSWKMYEHAVEVLVQGYSDSLCGAADVEKEDDGNYSCWVCCSHFYPGYYRNDQDYLLKNRWYGDSSPIFTKTVLGEARVERFTNYECYYKGMARVREVLMTDENMNDVKDIDIMWCGMDGDFEVIKALTESIFNKTCFKYNFI